MDELVEKVARALWRDRYPNYDFEADSIGWPREHYCMLARAALAAINASGTHKVAPVVATEGMISDGHALDPLACDVRPEEVATVYRRIWSAMIAAAPGVEP